MELFGLLSLFGEFDHCECPRLEVMTVLIESVGYHGCMALVLG
jgi:hypothetical protein